MLCTCTWYQRITWTYGIAQIYIFNFIINSLCFAHMRWYFAFCIWIAIKRTIRPNFLFSFLFLQSLFPYIVTLFKLNRMHSRLYVYAVILKTIWAPNNTILFWHRTLVFCSWFIIHQFFILLFLFFFFLTMGYSTLMRPVPINGWKLKKKNSFFLFILSWLRWLCLRSSLAMALYSIIGLKYFFSFLHSSFYALFIDFSTHTYPIIKIMIAEAIDCSFYMLVISDLVRSIGKINLKRKKKIKRITWNV